MESVDTKELKLQEQAQWLPALTPDACPSARRAKRMKCEVSVIKVQHTRDWSSPEASSTDVFLYCSHYVSHLQHDFSSFQLLPASNLTSIVGPLCENWTRWAWREQTESETKDGLFCRQARTRSGSTSHSDKIVLIRAFTVFPITSELFFV